MLRGDFGKSLYFKTDVLGIVLDKLPTTALLAVFSLIFALAISVPLGVLAAVYPNSWIDRLCLALAVVGQAMPNFFFALILIMVFSCWFRCCRFRAARPGRISSCRPSRSAITSRRRSCGWCAPA